MKPRASFFLPLSVFFASVIQAQNVEEAVNQHVEQDIARYARHQGWLNYQYSNELRAPAALKNLEKCQTPLVIKTVSANIIHRVRYRVSCPNSENNRKWSVNFNADIAYEVPVVSLVSALPRSHTLTEADLVFTPQRIRRNSSYYFQQTQLIGKKIKRDLRAGGVLRERDIEVEALVTRGREVTITIAHEALSISTIGIPLKSAGLGEVLKVRNKESGNIISAVVAGKNRVSVSVY